MVVNCAYCDTRLEEEENHGTCTVPKCEDCYWDEYNLKHPIIYRDDTKPWTDE